MRSLNFILALICLASANAHAQTERKDPAMITANLHCMQGSYGGGEYGPLELAYDDGKGLQTFVGTWDNTKSYVSISSESVQFTIEDLKQEHVNLAETHLPVSVLATSQNRLSLKARNPNGGEHNKIIAIECWVK